MKFGKQIQAQQISGWSQYYLDYKFLKKIVSSLHSKRAFEPAEVFPNVPLTALRPSDFAGQLPTDSLPLLPSSIRDEQRSPEFQARKAAFFFKLERELEKINAFYLQKEAELKLRLETLMSKRRSAATRTSLQTRDAASDHVEWKAVEEGFRLLERDLLKLQQFVELNATGFRKILKKWDKRSKSTTKELYLSRQVEVQPVFNRVLISQMTDTVASYLMDLTNVSTEDIDPYLAGPGDAVIGEGITVPDDLETNLRQAVSLGDKATVQVVLQHAEGLVQQAGGLSPVTRILWKAVIEAPRELADLILELASALIDYRFVDDINSRTCLHEAATSGQLRLVELCLSKGVDSKHCDAYGRSALHYACMNGHALVCQRLLTAGLPHNDADSENFTPLIYAVANGHEDCVASLVKQAHVDVQPSAAASDLIPLSIACQNGYLGIARLLIQHGASHLPNSNGEFPIHLAAREGHADVCRFLVEHGAVEVPDKYSEWTALFHAANHGSEECVRVLLEAGSNPETTDEAGNLPAHYAAWNGHVNVLQLLLNAVQTAPPAAQKDKPVSHVSPDSDTRTVGESDLDMIPSLSLPPPIMPHRVYGHNYLDKASLVRVQVSKGTLAQALTVASIPSNTTSARIPQSNSQPTTSLKLVMSALRELTPYSTTFPLDDGASASFTFKYVDLQSLDLEFSVYPGFGRKAIGRAFVVSSTLSQLASTGTRTVIPLLDRKLHVMGQMTIEVKYIKPFNDVKLEIGGTVETYWKTGNVQGAQTTNASTVVTKSPGSANTSPSSRSGAKTNGSEVAHMVSSLVGEYIQVKVQVTRDLKPVVYSDWYLPLDGLELGVSDVTLQQFESLARAQNRTPVGPPLVSTTPQWRDLVSRSLISFETFLKIIPPSFGLHVHLAYPPDDTVQQFHLDRTPDLNSYVDAVLREIYNASADIRRKIVFSSSNPSIAMAANWKQPNYPVFLSHEGGTQTQGDEDLSLSSAVEFATGNNLIGLAVKADLLERVPSLVPAIKNRDLLLIKVQPSASETLSDVPIDGTSLGEVTNFWDHPGRAFL